MDRLQFLLDERERLEQAGLRVGIRTVESAQGAWLRVDGRRVLNFSSNNYLGLANHPRLAEAARKAIDRYGMGPAAVRSIAGTLRLHTELEEKLARFKGVEATLSFQSGFCANLAAIPALVGREDLVFSDELNHASIIDGCRLSGAPVIRYAHCDAASLEQALAENRRPDSRQRALIVTDGVFSMDGDVAPLGAIAELAERHGALLMVDDAHGEGVLGRGGRGAVDHFGLHGRVDVEVGTLSKAFGVVGGFVAGRRVVIDHLRQKGRPFLFSSALPAADTAAAVAAVEILEESDALVRKLWDNARYFKERMNRAGFDTGASETPITPVMLGEAGRAQEFSRRLFERGVFAMALAFPTVPMGKARIRVMVSAVHEREDLDAGVGIFVEVGRQLGVV
ncbi:MAG: glycine C-acetyltransferase [Acidobacteriota bacterium]|jgi:glycine C-acetyltransferase|nr:glycine C-acetyltransferase [Acidobacteriota bacterium]NLT32102.1 glycine C-acetyltransferase [Acidobacteriota bacterium]